MFMCDFTKTPSYMRHSVYSELFLFANGDVSIGMGKTITLC